MTIYLYVCIICIWSGIRWIIGDSFGKVLRRYCKRRVNLYGTDTHIYAEYIPTGRNTFLFSSPMGNSLRTVFFPYGRGNVLKMGAGKFTPTTLRHPQPHRNFLNIAEKKERRRKGGIEGGRRKNSLSSKVIEMWGVPPLTMLHFQSNFSREFPRKVCTDVHYGATPQDGDEKVEKRRGVGGGGLELKFSPNICCSTA